MVVSAINTFTPKKKSRDLNKPPWINGELLKAIRKKKTLWQSLKCDPNNASTLANSRKMRQKKNVLSPGKKELPYWDCQWSPLLYNSGHSFL